MSTNNYENKLFPQTPNMSQTSSEILTQASIEKSLEVIHTKLSENRSSAITLEDFNAILIAISTCRQIREDLAIGYSVLEEFHKLGLPKIYDMYLKVLEKAANLPQETKQDLVDIRKAANSQFSKPQQHTSHQ
jgi:hypothetical protein